MKINFINEAIGGRLKKFREQKGYSLQDVGERLGVNRQTYYNFERGIRTISLDLLKRICLIYDVDYLELLEEVRQEMFPKMFPIKSAQNLPTKTES